MQVSDIVPSMSNREAASDSVRSDAHASAASAFVSRATARFDAEITELFVFGSTVRGEAEGLASDVDVLVVLDDAADSETITDELREIAYDVMLEFGPVVELHALSRGAFERSQQRGNPFVRNVIREGVSHA